jgi:hypothetical protein
MLVAPEIHELRFGSMTIRANLPVGWKVLNYKPNHHYIELEDDEGNTHRLLATDLIKGICSTCKQAIYVETRIGAMACPHCITGVVTWVWGNVKLSFVPEPGSRFVSASTTPLSSIEEEDTKP